VVTRAETGAAGYVDWLSAAYRPTAARLLALLRMAFPFTLYFWTRDPHWITRVPAVFWLPPPGPFSWITVMPPAWFIQVLWIVALVAGAFVILGWRTRTFSTMLSVLLIVIYGIAFSFGKVDHNILFVLSPAALGFAGWGSAWSVDSWLSRRRGYPLVPIGYPMVLWGAVIAFAMFTASFAKLVAGWAEPGALVTKSYAVSYLVARNGGALTEQLLSIHSDLMWKFFDYATLFAEGWLIVAFFFPTAFRAGLLLLCVFHIGVYAMLGINFWGNAFAYIGFFCLPLRAWCPDVLWLHDRLGRGRVAAASRSTEELSDQAS
jgi:hypothetical protein